MKSVATGLPIMARNSRREDHRSTGDQDVTAMTGKTPRSVKIVTGSDRPGSTYIKAPETE
jgi:hypothetical protein